MKFNHSHFLQAFALILTVSLFLLLSAGSLVNGNGLSNSNRAGLICRNRNHLLPVSASQVSCSAGNLKVSQISSTEATFNYIAHGSQVAEHGVCFGTEPEPMRISSKKVRAYKDVPIDLPEANTLFTVIAEQLKPATKYYARAYVKNSGEETFYSNEINFTTAAANNAVKQNNKDSLSGITRDTAALREYRRFNGIQTEKYENGNLMRVYNLVDGKLNGSYKSYNDKGRLVTDQNFIDGEPSGYFKTYFENGQLRGETNLKNGEQRPTKEYYENGNLKMESNCRGPIFQATGKIRDYFENGKLKKETTISDGKPILTISYDQEGRIISEQSEGRYISYWYEDNGKRHVMINGVEQK